MAWKLINLNAIIIYFSCQSSCTSSREDWEDILQPSTHHAECRRSISNCSVNSLPMIGTTVWLANGTVSCVFFIITNQWQLLKEVNNMPLTDNDDNWRRKTNRTSSTASSCSSSWPVSQPHYSHRRFSGAHPPGRTEEEEVDESRCSCALASNLNTYLDGELNF